MAKMITQKADNDPEKLKEIIIDSDVWVLITAKKDKDGNGASISVRESYYTGAVNVIAMLLEQKEIYDAVKAKMVQVKMMDKKQGNNSPDLNIN